MQHLLEEAETLPEGAGLFLGETCRLHPALCAFTSELFYEGRLQPVPGLEKQELAGPVLEGAGLWYLAVEHEGNQSSSAEEVGAVGALVERLTDGSTEWTDKEGGKMRLRLDQILIVAPYNAQVDALKERLPDALLNLLLKIEEERGRKRSQQTEARTLDLDLLLYGQEVITTDGLAIPHPRMHERAFVLIPLAEVSPQTRHPLLSTQIGVLADEVPDKETVNLFEQNWWRYDGNLEVPVPDTEINATAMPLIFQETANCNKATVRKLLQLLEQMDISAFLALFAADGRQINPFASGIFRKRATGREELRDYWQTVPEQFSGITFSIDEIYAMEDPNIVFAHYQGEMTLRDGTSVYTNDYYSIFRFNGDGEVSEHVKVFNPIRTARSFGLVDQIR